MAPVCRIETEVREGGEETDEVSYAITGVPRAEAEAATPPGRHRGHWGIEDRLHRVGDVTMVADRDRPRVGSGPRVLAALRDTAIGWLRIAGASKIAASPRRAATRRGPSL